MAHLSRLVHAGVLLGLVLGFAATARSQTAPASGTGILTTSAPVYLLPDATRTPLATLNAGTTVRILGRQGEWYRVEFRDQRFGARVGYVAASNLQVQPAVPNDGKSSPSASQPARRPAQRRIQKPRQPVILGVNGGVQTTSRVFGATSTIRRFEEDGTLTSAYSGDRPIVYDVSLQAGAPRGFSGGLAVTYTSKPLAGDVTAELPHPFFFDRRRTVSGTTADVKRQEIAAHINAGWSVPGTGSTRLTVFGGPSYFKVTQGLVTEVVAAEEYPYDTASFVSATKTEATLSRWGFNAGVDVSQRLSKYFGVGVVARYSRATFTFPIVDTQEVDIKVGGLQVSAGARIQF